MSFTVYNGYKLPMMSLTELNNFSMEFRKEAKRIAGELANQYLAEKIVDMIDDMPFLEEEQYVRRHVLYEKEKDGEPKKTLADYPNRMIFSVAYRNADHRAFEIKRTSQRDPVVDFECSVVFLPLKRKILALFFAEKKEYFEAWEKHPLVTSYGYGNNTDSIDGVSQREWKQRERDWKAVFKENGIPRDNGIIAKFVDEFPNRLLLNDDEILKAVPTLENRILGISRQRVIEVKYKEMQDSVGDDSTFRFSLFSECAEWLGTEEGKQALKEEAARVAPKLLPEITKDHLFADFLELREMYGKGEGSAKD